MASIEWIKSPNFWQGRSAKVSAIAIHWWGDPGKGYSIEGVINTFKNPDRQASAHYVVDGSRIVQMVRETDTAWTTGTANPYTISIEIDPKLTDAVYENAAKVIKDIRTRYGNLPLKRHRDLTGGTVCPGTTNLTKLDNLAKGGEMTKISKTRLIDTTWRYAARVPHDIEVENWAGQLTFTEVVDKLKGRDTAKKAMHYLQNFEQVANERDVLKVDNAKLRVLNETKDKAIAELEGQLALVSEDTANLNALGQALRWFLLRVGLKD